MIDELPPPTCRVCGAPAVRVIEAEEVDYRTLKLTGTYVGHYGDANGHTWQTRWPSTDWPVVA